MISKSGKDFAIMMEKVNDENIRFFNDIVKWFEFDENEDIYDMSVIDKFAYDRKGRMCAIELKTRDCQINTFDGIIIEPEKYDRLKQEYQEKGFIPLYINFFQDKYHVCIWDLRTFFNGKEPELVPFKITNYGYDSRIDYEYRRKLPQRYGHFYVYNKNTNRFDKRW